MKTFRIMFGVLFCLSLSIFTYSQSSKNDQSVENRLWFGGGIGLGLSSSTFNFGLSPMVGYKLTSKFSIGPRLELDYSYAKLFSSGGETISYNNLDWGLGLFSRHKLFGGLFAHAEYDYLWIKDPVVSGTSYLLDPENPTQLLTESRNRNEFNVGLGYSSGGLLSYEISLLYNLLEEANSVTIPWSVRIGFNYRF